MKEQKKQNSARTRRRKQDKITPISQDVTDNKPKNRNVFPLEFASPLLRIYAYATDVAILYTIIVVTKQFFGDNIWVPSAAPIDITILLGYFILPTALWGRTPGKAIIGIVVVDGEGYPCGLRAIPREVAGRFVAIIVVFVGIIWVLFDPKKQGWHDKLGGTYVVYHPKSGIASWFRKKTVSSK